MAAFRGSAGSLLGSSNGATAEVDPAIYRTLVEMIPLMESFMDQQGARSMFGHQASMIYTPAPLRDALYKTFESPLKGKKTVAPKRTPSRDDAQEVSLWEESENILRRIEGDSAQDSGYHSSCKDTCHLEVEIEELKQKLWEKDCLLQTIGQPPEVLASQNVAEELNQKVWEKDALLERTGNRHYKRTHPLETDDLQEDTLVSDLRSEVTGNLRSSEAVVDKDPKYEDMVRLQAQVEKLRQELSEKDHYLQSAQAELHEQQQELGEMRSLLEQAEIGMAKTNHKAASMESELNSLRCQVSTLRYQLDAVDATDLTDGNQAHQDDADREGPPYRVDMVSTISEQEVHQKTTFLVCVSGPNDEEQVSTVSEECKEEKEKLEFVRRKYLAAVIAAREKPVGESLLMVAECRRQLNNYLTDLPFLHYFGSQRS